MSSYKIRLPSAGFTLIELAVALTIMALIIGGLAVPLSTRIAEQQYIETKTNIDKAVDALIGFAVLNKRLPCPDMTTAVGGLRDGTEDVAGVAGAISGCDAGSTGINTTDNAASWGDLPWRTLGLQAPDNADAWNNRLRYAVFNPLTKQVDASGGVTCNGAVGFAALNCTHAVAPFGAAQLDIRCANTGTPAGNQPPGCINTGVIATTYSITTRAVFVVYSHGGNAGGATNINDLTVAKALPVSADELANNPQNELGALALNIGQRRQFVTRARTTSQSLSGEFDDVLSFMSANTLAAKLLNAGVWP